MVAEDKFDMVHKFAHTHRVRSCCSEQPFFDSPPGLCSDLEYYQLIFSDPYAINRATLLGIFHYNDGKV